MFHVTKAKYLSDYQIELSFDDGTEGKVDLEKYLTGPMFEPLKEKARFAEVKLDEELGIIVWSNGADLAPEFLRILLTRCNHRLEFEKLAVSSLLFGLIDLAYLLLNKEDLSVITAKRDFGKDFLV